VNSRLLSGFYASLLHGSRKRHIGVVAESAMRVSGPRSRQINGSGAPAEKFVDSSGGGTTHAVRIRQPRMIVGLHGIDYHPQRFV
jgi:hypothetical protein